MTDGVCPFAEWIPGVTTFNPGLIDRVGFCDHAAGGYMSTMRRASFWNNAGVSTHFAIGRDGSVIQLVNILDTAYAQGRLDPNVTWPPYQLMGGASPNLYLISTEHEDWADGHAVPGSEWTPAQYDADLRVKRWCVEEVKRVLGKDLLRFGLDSLAGHYMFDGVNRVNCPGVYWTRDYRERLYADLTGGGTTLADLDGSGQFKIVVENNCIVFYVQGIPVLKVGDEQGQYPGRIAKNFGGQFAYLSNPGDGVAHWADQPTD